MEERTKSIIGCFLFIGLILVLGVGGYFYTFKDINKKDITETNKLKVLMKNKKDKNKEFIYYMNEQVVSEELKLVYRNPRINLNNNMANAINSSLEIENEELRNSIKYISSSDKKDEEGNEIIPVYETDDIFSAVIRSYEDYKYNQYVSLILSDQQYDCVNGFGDYKLVRSYVFDVNENKTLSSFDVLGLYDKSLEDIKNIIKEKLENDQTEVEEEKTIDIEKTINKISLENNLAMYINENGKLVIKFIVNSNGMNYNDSIILD